MKRTLSILLAIAGLSLALSGCLRSASTPPPATPTPGDVIPFPVGTVDVIRDIVSATQTALAASGGEVFITPVVDAPTPGFEYPTETPVPVIIPSLEVPSTYTLQPGEHPYCIARRFNVDPVSLMTVNGLSGDYFPPGLTLQIPTGTTWNTGSFGPRSLRAHPTTYSVTSGETINSIACLFGDVDPAAIAAANGLSSPVTLSGGQVLNIP